MVTKHLSIRGRVQGVYYRQSMMNKANELGVTGWVRNRADGTVEAIVSGSSDAVESMIEWARHGPSAAKVTDLHIEDAQGNFDCFNLLPTS